MDLLNKIRALFGRQQVHLSWFEPYDYITALRNDVELRLIYGLGIAGVAFCFCMVMIVSNGWYFYQAYLATFAITAMLGMGCYNGATNRRNRPLAGEIAIRDHDIVLKYHRRGYLKERLLPYYGNYLETITIPYGAIRQCQLVPAEAMKTRFSLLMLQLSDEQKIIVMPNRIDRNRVKRVLAANRVEMKLLTAPPMGMTKGMNRTFAYGTGIFGGAAAVVGLFVGLIGATVQGDGGQPQQQANAAPVEVEDHTPAWPKGATKKELVGLDKPWEKPRDENRNIDKKGAANPQPLHNPWANLPQVQPDMRPGRPNLPSEKPPVAAAPPGRPSVSSRPPETKPAPAGASLFSNGDEAPNTEIERAEEDVFSPNPFGNK